MSKLTSGHADTSPQSSTVESLNRRLTQLLGQSQTVSNLVIQVNVLEDNITDISQKLNQLIGSDQNQITNRGMRRYFAKVKTLEEKVNRLTELLSTNECSSNPCRNGGTCVDTYNNYICKCPSTWEGPTCENDINECAVYAGTAFGCQNGATCTNLQGSYRCDCASNWYGIHCNQQHDDCSTASSQELCGHGQCINEKRVQPGLPKYSCICEPGWTKPPGNPACTQDINECQDESPKCSTNPRVMCINLPGTFYCGPCPTGYTGNGLWCDDINECEYQNGGCSISPFVECHNTPGSRRCGPCPTGYFGNGEQCMFQSVCNNNRGGCHPLATCIDNPAITATYRECRCPAGYVGSGEGLNGCVQAQGMSCANNPCQHGTCQMVGQSYYCQCEAGYYGTHCDMEEDRCFSSPCLNGGTCIRGQGTFTCNCLEGFSGPTCAEASRECGGYLQSNNGTLRYPETNLHYGHGESCAWVIVVEPGKVINVTFDHFHLEHGSNCEYDFLQLNDGPNAASRVLGRFCSDQLHGETLTSTHNSVYLWFHSDQSVSATGLVINWKAVDPVCGGTLNISEYGAVRSPGYPGQYPVNRTCSWVVRVPFGKRIQFSFATLMLEHHENCSFDYLKVYDGDTYADPLLGTYCTTVTPPPVITSGHTAMLLFHSDESVQDAGFNIAYTATPAIPGCGGTITTAQGSITSPNYPSVYHDNLLCEWLIRIHPENRIKISFTDFHLEQHANCGFDTLEIYDGADDTSPLLGRFCGTNLPPDILSGSNQVYIRFKTDMSQRYPGFKIDFKTICGGLYTELTGAISSPYYPDYYPGNSICVYDIRLPQGHLVNFTIHNIAIESHSNCRFDVLEIRDGNSESSPLMASLCGYSAPDSLVSTYNSMWMKFETDGSVQNRGFYAQYEAIDIGCGGIMTENNSIVASPRHPDRYPHSMTCTWLIRAPEAHVIQLSFTTFVLEQGYDCNFDYVLIEDTDGVQMGKFCGTTLPPVITSMDNTVLVKFVSDASIAREGFTATYTFLDTMHACGGDFYQESGVIRSPGFPNHNYPHSANCVWVIHARNSRQISLNVTNFNLESHTDCRYDFLEIRNGGYETSPVLGKYCGDQIMRFIRSHSNVIRLQFKTDGSMSAPGFEIYFDSTTVGCGGTLATSSGSIVSPNYPQPYPNNADCQWLIRVSEGSKISLSIVAMDIEEHDTCLFDYLEIFDGGSENSRSMLRVCNNHQHPGNIISTGNSMFLVFRSDFGQEVGGFHLVYQALCSNNILTKRRGVIESPNFPSPYPHNHNCSWTIQAPPGSNISISFSHLFIEGDHACSLDYVEVLEVQEHAPVRLGKFCGDMTTPPPTIHTSTNTAIVLLITDRSVSREGFRLEWTMNGCGGDIFDKPYGVITSPNYPYGYPHETVCYWHIWYPPGNQVEITLEDLDMEGDRDCHFDFLRVYGGENENSPRLLNICHTSNNGSVFTSHGNQLFIHFHSDASISKRGFKASFKKVVGGCGGRFTLDKASIQSPKHPEPYSPNDYCEYLIEVSPSSLVMLEFRDFEMPEAVNCSHGYVAIYDGNNSSAPLLLRHCGQKPEGFISSTGNQMLVTLVSDGNNVAKGFYAHYKQGCGRRLLADSGGEIMSLNYPDVYLQEANCSWIIYASDFSQKVSLTVTHLYIPPYENCTYSALQIYDGDRVDSPMTGQYCGHRIPPPIVSRGSILHVFLKNHGVFRATYGLLSEHCGGSYTSPMGSFASPGYPTNYDMGMECVWTIEASAGSKVHISFQDFNVEESEHCNTDYVEIHENDPAGRLIGKYCGNSIPNNVTSAHKLWIKFRSDDIGTAPGFLAHYQLEHGAVINGTSGDIASPGYPHQYQMHDQFEWTIIVPLGMFISASFLDLQIMNVGGPDGCYASVRLFDGMDEEAPLLGQYCGYQLPEPIFSTGNVMTVQFLSEIFYPAMFYLRWAAVDSSGVQTSTAITSACISEYTLLPNATEATIVTSPNFPSTYPSNTNCTYLFRTQSAYHIELEFETFMLEGRHPVCEFDKVESFIAQNPNVDSWTSNATYCDRQLSLRLSSPNNVVKLVMTTDSIVETTGFKVLATSACGSHIFDESGVIHSSVIHPHVQSLGRYDSFECEWVITVKRRRTIRLSFETFDIQSGTSCSTSHILLRNGEYATSPLLGTGRYCGSSAPQLPETSSNHVYVQVVYTAADGRIPSFDLRYETIQMACGGHIYLSDDIPYADFSSPNHPLPPTHDIECIWTIVSPPGTRLRIDFDDTFRLGPNCYSGEEIEYLKLHDGGTETAEGLGWFCGTDPPSSVMTTGNALFAKYLTTRNDPQIGFKATVRIAQCGGTISAFHAIMSSPNYPQNYGSSVECIWYLKMKYGYHITLTITEFETPSNRNCSLTDYLEIRDMDAQGPVLSTICGRPEELPITVEVPGPFAYVKFKSNSAVTAKGFFMSMEANFEEGCGGTFEDPTGVITSPRYPNALLAPRDCYWRIYAPVGRKIKVTVNELNLPRDENMARCSSFISIFNMTFNMVARPNGYLHRYCGNTLPSEIDSSTGALYITFGTTGLNAGQGFSLTYTTDEEAMCGGLLEGPSGNFTAPAFPAQEDSAVDCMWKVNTGENKTLSVKFDSLEIPGLLSNFCRGGVLFGVAAGRYIGGFCGNYTNGLTITSPYASTKFRLLVRLEVPFRGFNGTYNTSDCGGMMDGSNAVITSPGYPNAYPQSVDCHWVLTVPGGDVIRLTFEDLRLEEDCTKDYVTILNGVSFDSPVIGKFCGTHKPVPIVSSGSYLSILFHSDQFGAAAGFKVTTVDVQQGCGGLIHMLQGNFSSPNYPSRYDSNVECVWTIEYAEGYLVQIDFLGRFEIEKHDTCSRDYLQFEDLESDGSWSVREKKCGSETPSSFISKANKLRVTFHSNDQVVLDGFSLKYRAVCGGNFTHEKGDILSPNYPSFYTNNLNCTYTIGKTGDYIKLTFDDYFSVEGIESCSYDYLEIFQQRVDESSSQGVFCGNNAPAERSLQGPVILNFVTDFAYVAHGFKATYQILDCNSIRTDPTGIISSPAVTEDVIENLDCTWKIMAQPDRVIALRFIYMDIGYSYNCWRNYLEIRDGNETGHSLGRRCTPELPVVKSTANQLTLQYRNAMYTQQKGFRLYYYNTYGEAQGCGGLINGTSGVITSLDMDHDGLYEPDLDCGWLIVANVPDQVMKLTFTSFELEDPINGTCSSDYVEVREDGNMGSLIGRYCGSTVPSPIINSVDRVFVHFHSDDANNKAGFRLEYNVIPSPCGSSSLLSTTATQTLTSPNYPNAYPVNLRCKWSISVNLTSRYYYKRHSLEITISNLDIPCDGDFLQITSFQDLYYSNQYISHRLCGSNHPQTYNFRDGAEITFYSDAVNNGANGFSLTFKDDSCSQNYSNDGGVILNSAYPNYYNPESRCLMNITASEGKTVSLYFRSFTLGHNEDGCTSSYIKVYDGAADSYPILRTFCGYFFPDPIFATGSSLFIDLKMADGFGYYHMTYIATDKGQGCGGSIYSREGAFTSPLFPQPYNQTGECIWYITVPGYHTVRIGFNYFAFNSSAGCDTNYLEIYQGSTDDISTRIGRYCGGDYPYVSDSGSNSVVVKMVTDTTNDQYGFSLYFQSTYYVVDTTSVSLIQRDPEQV